MPFAIYQELTLAELYYSLIGMFEAQKSESIHSSKIIKSTEQGSDEFGRIYTLTDGTQHVIAYPGKRNKEAQTSNNPTLPLSEIIDGIKKSGIEINNDTQWFIPICLPNLLRQHYALGHGKLNSFTITDSFEKDQLLLDSYSFAERAISKYNSEPVTEIFLGDQKNDWSAGYQALLQAESVLTGKDKKTVDENSIKSLEAYCDSGKLTMNDDSSRQSRSDSDSETEEEQNLLDTTQHDNNESLPHSDSLTSIDLFPPSLNEETESDKFTLTCYPNSSQFFHVAAPATLGVGNIAGAACLALFVSSNVATLGGTSAAALAVIGLALIVYAAYNACYPSDKENLEEVWNSSLRPEFTSTPT